MPISWPTTGDTSQSKRTVGPYVTSDLVLKATSQVVITLTRHPGEVKLLTGKSRLTNAEGREITNRDTILVRLKRLVIVPFDNSLRYRSNILKNLWSCTLWIVRKCKVIFSIFMVTPCMFIILNHFFVQLMYTQIILKLLNCSEISPTRCNNCVFILRNGFTLHVSGDNLTHHQEYICCIWPRVSRLT